MMDRITDADLRAVEAMEDDNRAAALLARKLAGEMRRLQNLILRVGRMQPGESLAALATRYGVERAREWAEVLDEAEAIRKEREQGAWAITDGS